jgi:hypothetical protein
MLKVVSTIDRADILRGKSFSSLPKSNLNAANESIFDRTLDGGSELDSKFLVDGVPVSLSATAPTDSFDPSLLMATAKKNGPAYRYYVCENDGVNTGVDRRVSTTIPLRKRSDCYVKKYFQVQKALKNKRSSVFYWQKRNEENEGILIKNNLEFLDRMARWNDNGRPKFIPKVEHRNKKKAPSWFTGGDVDETPRPSTPEEKLQKQWTAVKYEKKFLVDTTWVDGDDTARIYAGQAVAHRELRISELEQHMLRCRVGGTLYMNGPKNQFAKYQLLFHKIAAATLDVCEAVHRWREQLGVGARINYQQSVKIVQRPPFTWSYMRQLKGSAGRKRTTVNYVEKMLHDMDQVFMKGQTEILGVLGHEPKLLLGPSRCNISADFIKNIPVCPLLLPSSLQEIVDGALPRDKSLRPLKTIEEWPRNAPAIWYGLDSGRVRFAAQYLLDEEVFAKKKKSLHKGKLDALSTVLTARAKTGRTRPNRAMSDLLAKDIILSGDSNAQPQIAVAYAEITRTRRLDMLRIKLAQKRAFLKEAVGRKEILGRKMKVNEIKMQIKRAEEELALAERSTIYVPVKDY